MASYRDIDLNQEGVQLFIDLWENQPSLWNPAHEDYKHKSVRNQALSQIAEGMGRWNADQVKRKIESLRAQYNRCRKGVEKKTGSGIGSNTTWVHYDRIRSFLRLAEYNHDEASNSSSSQTYNPGKDTDTGEKRMHIAPVKEEREHDSSMFLNNMSSSVTATTYLPSPAVYPQSAATIVHLAPTCINNLSTTTATASLLPVAAVNQLPSCATEMEEPQNLDVTFNKRRVQAVANESLPVKRQKLGDDSSHSTDEGGGRFNPPAGDHHSAGSRHVDRQNICCSASKNVLRNYGLSVGDRIAQLKNKARQADVVLQIERLIHQGILDDETPVDSDFT